MISKISETYLNKIRVYKISVCTPFIEGMVNPSRFSMHQENSPWKISLLENCPLWKITTAEKFPLVY